ncbi:hypothetical protein PsYK624_117960 [Phanerochaete sordida]|uniref:Ubiquitin 3 binding protein But2 C-terminal domain-containing protein n=1 Tax=Phanerochaete sordida TaxID=48140 RepID=A0A9P3GLB3_9APHY|nr:hypothetical protein PsYK624_117960 [Phanerochaete sordida]
MVRAYKALPQEAEDSEEYTAYANKLGQRRLLFRSETWAILVAVFCAILNVVLVTWSPSEQADLYASTVRLPRPNQYIGLERVNRKAVNATLPDPIATVNLVITQLAPDSSYLVWPMDTHQKFIPKVGNVSVDDRHFVVNSTTNSLAQFRVRDWGMERCQLALSLQLSPVASAGASPVMLSEPPPVLDIWKVGYGDEDDLIDIHTSSQIPRPARQSTLPMASLPLILGSRVVTETFPCRADSLQTFEFACHSGELDCVVDFWQNSEPMALAGLYMIQYATK